VAYQFRQDPISGDTIVLTDKEAARHDRAVIGSGTTLFMALVVSQMMLPSGTNGYIRLAVLIISLVPGILLGMNLLGIFVACGLFVAAFVYLPEKIAFLPGVNTTWLYMYISGILGALVNIAAWVLLYADDDTPPRRAPVEELPPEVESAVRRHQRKKNKRNNLSPGFESNKPPPGFKSNKLPPGFKSNFD
jgi:hypothetical protein